METIEAGFLLAIATGLATLAWREPAAYARLFPFVYGLLFATFALLIFWDIAAQYGAHRIMPFVPPEKIKDAQNAYPGPLTGGLLAVFVVSLIYVVFLRYVLNNIRGLPIDPHKELGKKPEPKP
ncbi:MAG TPA: hypothetical protein VFB16_15760 [Bauldia sp.]|nr:hypothetical protein [Bauldia sp.]